MSELIPPLLIPPGVNDERNRAFMAALSAKLAEFNVSALLVQDAMTAPVSLLPAMVIEGGLTEFVSPNMREDLLRALIDAAPEIHAMSGTIAGVRRALSAIGVSARWTQWWQMNPKGPHDTHKVVLYLSDTLINGQAPLDLANQRAAARIINATKRWSQDVAVQYGLRGYATVFAGATTRSARTIRLKAPQLGNEHFAFAIFAGAATATLRTIRLNAQAA